MHTILNTTQEIIIRISANLMCGILFYVEGIRISEGDEAVCADAIPVQLEDFLPALKCRGPDGQGFHTVILSDSKLHFASSLLQLRGSQAAPTPLIDPDTSSVLLFNGQIYDGIDVPPGSNDAQCLLRTLSQPYTDVARVLSQLQGPWALIFWHCATQTLWFARDPIGRRSLLMHRGQNGFLCTSVGPVEDGPRYASTLQEVPPGMYTLAFSRAGMPVSLEKVPWANTMCRSLSTYQRLGKIDPETDSDAQNLDDLDLAIESRKLIFEALLHSVAVRCRTLEFNAPYKPQNIEPMLESAALLNDPPAPVLLLFSGGIDSTLLAALLHKVLPIEACIDLVCVCFDPDRASPDRLAAFAALRELQQFAPDRNWRLLVREPGAEEQEAVRQRIVNLLAPADTYMDFNIGMALWFAAQGVGYLVKKDGDSARLSDSAYVSQARGMFVGHGADELFGGYGRHRTRFKALGWEGVAKELEVDLTRLWLRNLGRDDRIFSDHSREARHPFLDESLIEASLKVPLWHLCDLRLPLGAGDKMVLRRIVREELGLVKTAVRVKRAIQFGSRLAKQTNAREFGGTRQANNAKAGKMKFADTPTQTTAQQLLF